MLLTLREAPGMVGPEKVASVNSKPQRKQETGSGVIVDEARRGQIVFIDTPGPPSTGLHEGATTARKRQMIAGGWRRRWKGLCLVIGGKGERTLPHADSMLLDRAQVIRQGLLLAFE